MDNRGIDTDPGWINRKFRELEAKIEAMRSERRAAATTIGSGGLTIDGGDLILLEADGDEIFVIGEQPYGDRGISAYRDDGTEALSVRKPLPGFPQRVAIFDRDGHEIFTEGGLSDGIDRPFFSIPIQPYLASAGPLSAGPNGFEVSTTSTTFATTHVGMWRRSNYLTRWRWQIRCSDASTAAEVRVVVNGTHLGTYLGSPWTGVRAAGSTSYVEVLSARLTLPGAYLDQMSVTVQARRSAGTGTVSVALTEARGD